MNTSENTIEITKALIAFHQEIGKIKKDAKNPFFKSDYATLSSILDAIKDPLTSNGLTFVQFPDGENGLTTRLMHESGEWMEANYKMIPAKNDPQGLGSAITYQRRYSLGAVLGLNIDNDDDGNAASSPAVAQKPSSKPRTKEDDAYLNLKGKILTENDFGKLQTYKASLMEKADIVTPTQYKDLITLIDTKIKKASLKETKQESRNTAELDIVEDTTIQINESE
jgi:ERF superfamily